MNQANERPALLEFPCWFPVKAVGTAMVDFDAQVVAIIRRHVADLHEGAVSVRASKTGRYTAVTVLIRADSQQQLDAIYQDLSACPDILMAL